MIILKNCFRLIFLLIFSVFTCFDFYGQDCEVIDYFDSDISYTISEEEYQSFPWYENPEYAVEYYQDFMAGLDVEPLPNARQHPNPGFRIPVVFWVYRDDNGGRGIDEQGDLYEPLPTDIDIQKLMDVVNHAFGDNDVPMQLYLGGVITVDNSKRLIVKDRFEKIKMASENRLPGYINIQIYVEGGNEYFWDTNAIFIHRRVFQSSSSIGTFAHEVGHYFGLLHTHFGHGVPCLREPVTRGEVNAFCFNDTNRPRCSITGDLLCDTPADPKMSTVPTEYIPYKNDCKWEYYMTDYFGDRYWPQVSNYMGYGNSGCRKIFTPGQRGIMLWTANFRANTTYSLYGIDHRNNSNNQVDVYEPDNSHVSAREVVFNEWQEHTFHTAGVSDEEDWYKFTFRPDSNLSDLVIRVEEETFGVIADIDIMEQEVTGLPGLPLENIQREQAVPSSHEIIIPCNELRSNFNYLIRVRKASDIGAYRIQFSSPGKDASLYGATLLCKDQPVTFGVTEIDGIPASTSFRWGFNNGIRAVTSTLKGPEFTAEATGTLNGPNAIKLRMSNSCGSIEREYPVYTGRPQPSPAVSGPAVADPGELLNYWGEAAPGATGHYWIVPVNSAPCAVDYPCWQLVSSNGPSYLKVITGYNSGYIMLRGTNACGPGDSKQFWVEINTPESPDDGTPGGGPCVWCRIELAPNPSDTEFEVSFVPSPGMESVEMPDSYTIRIFDQHFGLLYEKVTRARKWKVPVQQFEPGSYILQISTPVGVETRHVLVD